MTGRPKTTGRFRSRAELVDRIRFQYYETSAKMSQIAYNCDVSPPTVETIITNREWEKLDPVDYLYSDPDSNGCTGTLRHDEEPFEPREHLDAASLRSIGEGWMPDPCRVNLPDWVKRDLEIA